LKGIRWERYAGARFTTPAGNQAKKGFNSSIIMSSDLSYLPCHCWIGKKTSRSELRLRTELDTINLRVWSFQESLLSQRRLPSTRMDLSRCFVVRWWTVQALISSNYHATCQNFIMKYTQQLHRSVPDLQASGGQSSESEALGNQQQNCSLDITCDVIRTDPPVSTVLPSQPCTRTEP